MGRVLLVNGSAHEKGCTYTALMEAAKVLKAHGIESELLQIGTKPVAGCIACGKCAETGRCIFTDQVNEIGPRLPEFDALIVGSPVYYSGPSAQVCAFMDRLCYAYGAKLANKLAASVVSCRRGGATAAFERLNQYYLMENMIVVGSQYWNQIHGRMAEDALKDAEGLQTMRTLAENMAWLIRSVEAGRQAGISAPVYEAKQWTNFIR